jgi:hypothetical protein
MRGKMKKDRTMILNVNFVNVKYKPLRPTDTGNQWVVELHGGCGDNYTGQVVRLNLKGIDWLLTELKRVKEAETDRWEELNEVVEG